MPQDHQRSACTACHCTAFSQCVSLVLYMQILDSLVDDVVISPEKADAAKAHFAKLHQALFGAMTREKNMLKEAKALKRKLDVSFTSTQAPLRDTGHALCATLRAQPCGPLPQPCGPRKADGSVLGSLTRARRCCARLQEDERAYKAGMSADGGAEATIDSLREDVEAALAEAALAQERQQLMQLQVVDLQRQVSAETGRSGQTEKTIPRSIPSLPVAFSRPHQEPCEAQSGSWLNTSTR